MKLNSKKIRILAVSALVSAALCGAGFASYSMMNAQDAVVAKAEDSVVYSLNPVAGKNNNYAANCDIVVGGVTWNVGGNASSTIWKIGGKSLTKTDRVIYSKTAINENISKVDITFGAASSITVNSLKFTVHSTANDAENNLNPLSSVDVKFKANSTVSVERPSDALWEGAFYRMTFNVTVVSSSKNKYVEFKGAKFYGSASTKPYVEVTNAPTSNIEKGDKGTYVAKTANATNPVVTWSSSDPKILKIDEKTGAYEALSAGVVTLTVSMTSDGYETPATASYEIKVNYGLVTIAQANEIAKGLSGDSATSPVQLTISGYIVNLNGDNQKSGSERMLTLSDKKSGEKDGNQINVFGIYNNNPLRNLAILNGTVTITANAAKYNGSVQLASPSWKDYKDDAMTFAKEANALLDQECANRDVKAETWAAIKAKYEALDEYAKAKLSKATTSDSNSDIKNFVSRYVIIVNGYKYEDFMSSSAVKARRYVDEMTRDNTVASAWIIGASLFVLLATGCFVFLKKKKHN